MPKETKQSVKNCRPPKQFSFQVKTRPPALFVRTEIVCFQCFPASQSLSALSTTRGSRPRQNELTENVRKLKIYIEKKNCPKGTDLVILMPSFGTLLL